MNRIYIGNLDPTVTSGEIKKRFSAFGSVDDVQLTVKNDVGEAKAFCHVTLDSASAVKQCIRTLHRTTWNGRTLRVEPSKPSFTVKQETERKQQQQQMENEILKQKEELKKKSAIIDLGYQSAKSLSRKKRKRCLKQPMSPPEPVEGERGWRRVKGRLLPKLKLLPKRSDEAPIRVVPEDQSAKIIFLNEGPLASKKEPKSIEDLQWEWDLENDELMLQRKLKRQEYEERVKRESLEHQKNPIENQQSILKQNNNNNNNIDINEKQNENKKIQRNGERDKNSLRDIDSSSDSQEDDAFEVVKPSRLNITFEAPIVDESEESSSSVSSSSSSSYESSSSDSSSTSSSSSSVSSTDNNGDNADDVAAGDDDDDDVTKNNSSKTNDDNTEGSNKHDSSSSTTTNATTPHPSLKTNVDSNVEVQIQVPRLRSLFFGALPDDDQVKPDDLVPLNKRSQTQGDAAVVAEVEPEKVTTRKARKSSNDDDDEDSDARPVSAALDAKMFRLLPVAKDNKDVLANLTSSAQPDATAETVVEPVVEDKSNVEEPSNDVDSRTSWKLPRTASPPPSSPTNVAGGDTEAAVADTASTQRQSQPSKLRQVERHAVKRLFAIKSMQTPLITESKGRRFWRRETIDDAKKKWKTSRKTLTIDYKRKHSAAGKQRRKISHKLTVEKQRRAMDKNAGSSQQNLDDDDDHDDEEMS